MKTTIIPCDRVNAIHLAKEVLDKGRIVAFPTDTLYGIAARCNDSAAIKHLYKVKKRDLSKAIAILIADMRQLSLITPELSGDARRLADRFWPGALTLVVAKRSSLPTNLSPTDTIGVRMPNHQFALALLAQTGPLATTSANISGGKDPLTAEEVISQLNGRIDLILDGGRTPGIMGSTVVDCTSQKINILRQGSISEKDIMITINR
jgi:L-threonylcarbamoyladenylate synthase